MSKRDQINLVVERALHRHIQRIKESTMDFTQLYIRKNNVEVDRSSMAAVLDIVGRGIDSESMNKLDLFMKELNDSLAEFDTED